MIDSVGRQTGVNAGKLEVEGLLDRHGDYAIEHTNASASDMVRSK